MTSDSPDTTSEKFRIFSGKVYKDRRGHEVSITRRMRGDDERMARGYRFLDDNRRSFMPSGRFISDTIESPFDLVEESSDSVVYTNQVFHPEIDFDHYVKYIYERNNWERPKAKPRINPHTDREMNLMKAGLKPCASVMAERWGHSWEVESAINKWFVVFFEPSELYFVSVQGEEWRVDALIALHEKAIADDERSDTFHMTQGRLLGYSQSDVRAYIHMMERRREVEERQDEIAASDALKGVSFLHRTIAE
jgi:hypothetical protein